MIRLVAERTALGLLTLLAISALLFFGTNLLPGDVASALLGQSATPEALHAIRISLGLDQPAWYRYLVWLGHVFEGDFGTSLASGRPIVAEVMPRLGNTLFLAGVAAIVSVPLAVGLGLLSAIREGGLFDRLVSILSLMTISVPEFFVGYVVIIVFSVQLGWLPSLATIDSGMSLIDRLEVVALPAFTLVLVVLAHMLRMTRASILSVMSAPYVEMAFLKGLSRSTVVMRHALPNAAAPIIAVVALNLGYLVVGVVVVEVVFVYPGVGQLMVDAVSKRDLPLVQACGLVFAATYVGLNTLADVVAILVNPRLKRPR
ncbi:ABC transporter permease [Segnochrobactrum spirostomi]|uniref:ABC transporter permease n=1 Tax=Segnochrobactrum spirostomi TaxID=2608987 RepID=A0A6A7XZ50_9HYPH|nr:ABC transporter permease [Segnochrobactrum spirostomi]MQT11803.1 ABC transporter permease [Segnochrobactrum spirostomi]